MFKRLEADAAARQALPARQYSYVEGTTAAGSGPQGWTQSVSLCDTKQVPDGSIIMDKGLDSMHPTALHKLRRMDPVQYFATVRPQCKTTCQTLRMLGTYASDTAVPPRTFC